MFQDRIPIAHFYHGSDLDLVGNTDPQQTHRLSVADISDKRDPGEAPHTTGLLVKEVADAWDLPRAMTRKIHGVRLYAPSLRFIDL